MKHLAATQIEVKYPFRDYNFRHLTRVEKVVALGLLNESEYLAGCTSEDIPRLDHGTIFDISNKSGFKSRYDRIWICRENRYYWLAESPEDTR
jgi:hypothetical protein